MTVHQGFELLLLQFVLLESFGANMLVKFPPTQQEASHSEEKDKCVEHGDYLHRPEDMIEILLSEERE